MADLTIDIEEYLRESNAIESVYGDQALRDSVEAWRYLREQKQLTQEIVRGVHARVLQHRQPDIAGEYRDVQVYVGDHVPPRPDVVESEIAELLEWVPENAVEAIEWHVRFETVHPFADGNGRVGRLLYLWHCWRLGLEPVMWRAKDKQGYYSLFRTPETGGRTRSGDSGE